MSPSEIQLQVILDPQGRVPEGALTFGVAGGEGTIRYDSLRELYYDLLAGRPLPTVLVLDGVRDVSSVIVTTLFLQRDLALHPEFSGLVAAAEIACWGVAGLAHLDPDLAKWLRFLEEYLVAPTLSTDELARRLQQAVGWCRDYLDNGNIPSSSRLAVYPKVLDIGTGGFVLATQDSPDLEGGWLSLFGLGYLKGCLVNSKGSFLIARKSHWVEMDLTAVYVALMSLGGDWVLETERDFLWGSGLPLEQVMQVLVRA